MIKHNELNTSIYFSMISKAQVVAIYKHNIYSNHTKTKKHFSIRKMSYISLTLLMIFVLVFGAISGEYKSVMSSVLYPITSLYSDKNDLQFTWSDSVINESEISFQMPLVSSDVKVVDGSLIIRSENNGIVRSIEQGIVIEVAADLYSVRYVKVQHSETIFSIVENLYVVSVKTGDKVTKKTILGTSKINENIIVSIYKDGVKIKEIAPNKNEIKVLDFDV